VKATWFEGQEIRSHPVEALKDRNLFLRHSEERRGRTKCFKLVGAFCGQII